MNSNYQIDKSKIKLEAVVFDMDGVIVDSEPLHLLAFQEFLARYSIKYSEADNREFLGRSDLDIAQVLITRHKLNITAEQLLEAKENILASLLTTNAVARPGLFSLLEKIEKLGLRAAVASSATLPTIELVLGTLGIKNKFHNYSSADEVAEAKPYPDVYLLACRRMKISPKNCIAIEDTINGIKAAKTAGLFCISVPCEATKHEDHSLADMNLTSLENINLQELSSNWSKLTFTKAR